MGIRTGVAGFVLTGALVTAGIVAAPAATAAPSAPAALNYAVLAAGMPAITQETAERAIDEARAAGALSAETVRPDGSQVYTITAGSMSFDLGVRSERSRLGAGNDKNGVYVDFNEYDQGVILSGAGSGLAAAACLLGPAVCAIASVVIVLAGTAIGGNLKCGHKVMRVHATGRPAPYCV